MCELIEHPRTEGKYKTDDSVLKSAGTPAFYAPEMCVKGAYHGKAADVWASGADLPMAMCGCDLFIAALGAGALKSEGMVKLLVCGDVRGRLGQLYAAGLEQREWRPALPLARLSLPHFPSTGPSRFPPRSP